ncbi:MAG: beta-ketoacyl-[acyl-carrier-protein] synthase family protein [Janthinobacterium lividum]
MRDRRAVMITGLGVLSPIGLDVAQVAASLAVTRSGIGLVRAAPLKNAYPAGFIGAAFASSFAKLELAYLDRCQHLAIIAARQAIADAGLGNFADFGERAGVYYGNVNGGAGVEQLCYEHLLVQGEQAMRPFWGMAVMRNGGAAQISIRHQVRGPVITHSSACAASGVALGEAARAIADGHLDIAVAGGAEAPLTASLFATFDGARTLAQLDEQHASRSCKPFSSTRNGLVIGEGAAFLVLEAADLARRRGAPCYGYLSGYGVCCDAYHVGTPQVQGLARAMSAALEHAALAPAEIGYLNAHATATVRGDLVEAEAIQAVFGGGGDAPLVSSTKSVHGHLLGAASALELLLTVVAMNAAMVPATANLESIDPRCALNHVALLPLFGKKIDHAMSFSSGFGGTNVALIVSRRERPG